MNFSKILIYLFVGVLMWPMCSCQSEPEEAYFKTEDGQLLDANGNNFVMRGVNMPHAWFTELSYDALDELASKKANCVRIVWESKLPESGLDSILQKCIDLEMIPMVELHDATGDSTATKLYQMAKYFVSPEMKSVINKYEKYILVNIANEWGNHEVKAAYWRDAYEKCISLLRAEGLKSVIVIDAPGWGQDIDSILYHANELIHKDPLHNLLFSVHMYGSWNDHTKIKDDLKKVCELSIPIIVGEFGYNFNNGDNNLSCKVDHKQILETCADLNLGYLAWSWTGNNEENKWLDLVEFNDWKTLTLWGEDIFNSPNGIIKTARKASVFNQ